MLLRFLLVGAGPAPHGEVARAARTAGLRFAAYDLGISNDQLTPLSNHLFPSRLPRPRFWVR